MVRAELKCSRNGGIVVHILNQVAWNVLTWAAALIFIYAFVIYNKAVFHGGETGPFSTWGPNALIASVSALIYVNLTIHFVNALVYIADATLSAMVAAIVLKRLVEEIVALHKENKRIPVKGWSIFVAVGSVTALMLWRMYPDTQTGYVMNLAAYILAAVPFYEYVWNNPGSERTKPWLLWTIAICLSTAALPFEGAKFMDYLVHLVYLGVHGGMTLLTLRKPKPIGEESVAV